MITRSNWIRAALLASLLSIAIGGCQKSGESGAASNADSTSESASSTKTSAIDGSASNQPIIGEPPFPIADSSKIVTTPSGLKYYIVQQGTGNKPRPGQKVIAMYHGLLTNGEKFDSSYDRKQPFDFTIGQGQVIRGWDEGFQLLSVGTKAILIIPPDLGYGAQPMGNIPPNSTLIFHVELINIIG